MSKLVSRRTLAVIALLLFCIPALATTGCRGEVDDEGASVDVAGGAEN